MIDDLSAARPQSGLSSASVVWQAPAEGGIPRYMAIFQDTLPKDIGPVRSSRYYYIAWAAEWRAVYAHAGGSPQALGDARGEGPRPVRLQRRRVPLQRHLLPDHDPRRPPHNLYTTGPKLRATREAARGQGPGLQAGLEVRARCAARSATVRRHDHGRATRTTRSATRYDRTTNTYLRSVTGEKKQTDAGDRRPDRAQERGRHADARSGRSTTAIPAHLGSRPTVVGSGPAWISTNGRTIKGTWKKTAMTKPTQFYDASGKEVTLTIGQTFVQVDAGGLPAVVQGRLGPAAGHARAIGHAGLTRAQRPRRPVAHDYGVRLIPTSA